MTNDLISRKTAQILIEKKCVEFSLKKKFKLTSGKLSMVYCDCRKIISYPKERNILINFAVRKIRDDKSLKDLSNISGGESAGIPFGSFIAQKIKLPLCYIRKKKKGFGKNSQIEGIMNNRDKVLLVEDLITDGGSKINFLNALSQVKAEVRGIFVIFNYGINEDYINFKGKKIKIISLASWQDIIKILIEKKELKDKNISKLVNFLKSMGVKNLKSFL